MAELHDKGTWVEIHATVLAAGERAPQVPQDTQGVPLEMRTRGFLQAPAMVGDEVEIRTAAGRVLRGSLAVANPAYEHGFGVPIAALLPIGAELRALLRGNGAP